MQADAGCGPHRGPGGPAAHVSDYLALLPSGPDAVRRLILHRFRTAVRPAIHGSVYVVTPYHAIDHMRPRTGLSVFLGTLTED